MSQGPLWRDKDASKGFCLVGQAYRLVGVHASGIRLKNG